jgi:CheY-like chemotaxis protein
MPVAGDGETGYHFADYYRPSAVVLDIGRPGIDGWTVMDRLKSNPELRHIPVHFMSAADETLDAMRMGAVGYLTKPVTLEAVNKALARIEGVLSKPVKRLLVVEDAALQRESIRALIGNGDVETVAVETGEEAYEMLETETFDCMILDLGLKDMSGFELLRRSRNDGVDDRVPIIVYTGRELSREEEEELSRHAESIIIKGARSPERLLDETTLFLHRVEANLPEDKQRMLRMVHDKEAMLAGKKILLVDDDMRNVFALSSALEAHGMEVAIARNGREGVEKLSSNPDMDLVLMDIMMPEMDGYEAMRAIRKRKRFQNLPIIALTAKAMKGDRNKCIEAGASDYMAKPVDTDKLFSLWRVVVPMTRSNGQPPAPPPRPPTPGRRARHRDRLPAGGGLPALGLRLPQLLAGPCAPPPAAPHGNVRHALHPAMMHRALTEREFFGSLLATLSINVTEMFRDPPFYRALREEIVPRLRTWPFVKIWHAGCSTGEEVYSMAIVLREAGLEGRARIYATDFNPEALRRAKEGIYPLEAIRNYTRNYQAAGGEASFADYYTARYESALIDRTLREHVVFSEHNLVTDGVFGEMHLIFCRNVLIYFNAQLQARALDLFHDSLCPGGFLCLGTKESMQFCGHPQAFEQVLPGQKIFRRKLATACPKEPNREPRRLRAVVMGASAGGLEALARVLGALKADSRCPSRWCST